MSRLGLNCLSENSQEADWDKEGAHDECGDAELRLALATVSNTQLNEVTGCV